MDLLLIETGAATGGGGGAGGGASGAHRAHVSRARSGPLRPSRGRATTPRPHAKRLRKRVVVARRAQARALRARPALRLPRARPLVRRWQVSHRNDVERTELASFTTRRNCRARPLARRRQRPRARRARRQAVAARRRRRGRRHGRRCSCIVRQQPCAVAVPLFSLSCVMRPLPAPRVCQRVQIYIVRLVLTARIIVTAICSLSLSPTNRASR